MALSEANSEKCFAVNEGSSTANTHRIVNQIPNRGQVKAGSKCTAEIILHVLLQQLLPSQRWMRLSELT